MRYSFAKEYENCKVIAEETVKCIRQGYYFVDDVKVELPDEADFKKVICINPSQSDDILLDFIEDSVEALVPPLAGRIRIVSEDAFAAAKDIEACLVMNFANAYHAGGCFLAGGDAQEEALCRGSTLYASIGSEQAAEMYLFNRKHKLPMESDYMLISPEVCVFRDRGDYFLSKPFMTSVVTIPAPDLYWAAEGIPMYKIDQCMLMRIEKMLAVAMKYGYKSLVLGAWGCGAFGHDAGRVAGYFYELLVKRGYRKYFEQIIFAIIGEAGEGKRIKFQNVFGDVIEK